VSDVIYHVVKVKVFQKNFIFRKFLYINLLPVFHVFFKGSDWLKTAWKATAVVLKTMSVSYRYLNRDKISKSC
jgi:hypothetical protein